MRFRWLPAREGGGGASGRMAPGFTLLEILAAVTLLILILAMTSSIINSSSNAWRQANAKIESFQSARAAFDVMTARLSKATLNTYWDYYNSAGAPYRLAANPTSFTPAFYGRYSDLHFLCGRAVSLLDGLPSDLSATSSQAVFFVAPTGLSASAGYNGLSGLLAACGYFVAFGSDDSTKPSFPPTPSRYRWRLMEVSAPVEELHVFSSASGTGWFASAVSQNQVRSVAENVIALIVWPKKATQDDPEGDDLSPDYGYDSRTAAAWSGSPLKQPVQSHQLPPNLQVTMVVIDEVSARRMENGSQPPAAVSVALAGLFENQVTNYDNDLGELERRLAEAGIGYQVFSSNIALRESKWTP